MKESGHAKAKVSEHPVWDRKGSGVQDLLVLAENVIFPPIARRTGRRLV